MADTDPDPGTDNQSDSTPGADGQETATGAEGAPDVSWSDDPTAVDEKPEATPEPTPPEPMNRLRLIGVGLIASVVIGYPPLRDAIQGNGPFENAMLRFVLCFGACVLAASVIGRLLDGAPPPEPEEVDEEGDGASTTEAAPSGTSTAGNSTTDRSAEGGFGSTDDAPAEDPVTT